MDIHTDDAENVTYHIYTYQPSKGTMEEMAIISGKAMLVMGSR